MVNEQYAELAQKNIVIFLSLHIEVWKLRYSDAQQCNS
jgi:hypothetical protein